MYEFWRKWFVAVSAGMVAMGLGLAVIGLTPAMGLITDLYNPSFWFGEVDDPGIRQFQTFAFGVMGALMAGWGTMSLGLGLHAMKERARWSWVFAVDSIAIWFVVDCAMSWASGAMVNIVGNSIFLLLLAPPLLGMRSGLAKGHGKSPAVEAG